MKQSTRQFSSRWFRVYDEAVDDPKLQTLPDALFKFWFNCLCIASKSGGFLPSISDLAWRTRKPEKEVAAMIASLYEHGLLDQEADTFSPHNWERRQYSSDVSTDRVREFRKRKGNVSETFHETQDETRLAVSETPSEQSRADTEQIQSRGEQSAPVSVADYKKRPRSVEWTAVNEAWKWYQSEFPDEVNTFIEAQLFISVMETQQDLDDLKGNLPLWKLTSKWIDGYRPTSKNFLSERQFKVTPKPREPPSPRNGKYDVDWSRV